MAANGSRTDDPTSAPGWAHSSRWGFQPLVSPPTATTSWPPSRGLALAADPGVAPFELVEPEQPANTTMASAVEATSIHCLLTAHTVKPASDEFAQMMCHVGDQVVARFEARGRFDPPAVHTSAEQPVVATQVL